MIILRTFANEPYPDCKVLKKNLFLAKLLSHLYAGCNGEVTSVCMYVYQSMVLEKDYPEIARILLDISKVEMHHIYLLGKYMLLLGESPIFSDMSCNVNVNWNSHNVYYDTDLKTILEIDIESESLAINDYESLYVSIGDECVKKLIERIILDEQIHLEIFKKLYLQISC